MHPYIKSELTLRQPASRARWLPARGCGQPGKQTGIPRASSSDV